MTIIKKKKKKKNWEKKEKRKKKKKKKNEFWTCDLKFYKMDALPTELARIL